jgi:hypothetical protein
MEMLARSVPGVAVGTDAQKSVLRIQDGRSNRKVPAWDLR